MSARSDEVGTAPRTGRSPCSNPLQGQTPATPPCGAMVAAAQRMGRLQPPRRPCNGLPRKPVGTVSLLRARRGGSDQRRARLAYRAHNRVTATSSRARTHPRASLAPRLSGVRRLFSVVAFFPLAAAINVPSPTAEPPGAIVPLTQLHPQEARALARPLVRCIRPAVPTLGRSLPAPPSSAAVRRRAPMPQQQDTPPRPLP